MHSLDKNRNFLLVANIDFYVLALQLINNVNKRLSIVLFLIKVIEKYKRRKKNVNIDYFIDLFANNLVNLVAKDNFNVVLIQLYQ